MGAEAGGVGQVAGVGPLDGAGPALHGVLARLGAPRPLQEVVVVAVLEGRGLRRSETHLGSR